MSERTILEAVRDGLIEEMRRDPMVWAVGEDLHIGGLYGQYKGLIEEFGPSRVVASPISEAMIVSAGLGGALVGTRPVVEMRIADFALPAIDEIVNQTAKARFMFGGQARVPVVDAAAAGPDGIVGRAAFAVARILVRPRSRPRRAGAVDTGGLQGAFEIGDPLR